MCVKTRCITRGNKAKQLDATLGHTAYPGPVQAIPHVVTGQNPLHLWVRSFECPHLIPGHEEISKTNVRGKPDTGTAGHVERKRTDVKKSDLGIGGARARRELFIVWDSYLRSLLLVYAFFRIDVYILFSGYFTIRFLVRHPSRACRCSFKGFYYSDIILRRVLTPFTGF